MRLLGAAPTVAADAATKGYVDSSVSTLVAPAVIPSGGAGNTAQFTLNNLNGQVWLNSNNSGGAFAIYDDTNGKTPFAIQPNAANNAMAITVGSVSLGVFLDLNGNKVTELGAPTVSTDAATKGYVDAAVTGGGGGGISRSVSTLSGVSTLAAAASTDYVVFVGVNGAPTLPTAVGNTNRYTLKNIDTDNKTVLTTSSQLIDGSTSIVLRPEGSVDLISDGANWRVI